MKRGANLLNNTKQQVADQRIKKMIPYVTHVSYGIFAKKILNKCFYSLGK